ncbi:MAG: hydroxymethylglutaryl-CoA lyase [Gammaproteobacteria bacterium]|nr:hydroxymethylglutaryl-CoA lyase [Gammaproteobacteria bacterium]
MRDNTQIPVKRDNTNFPTFVRIVEVGPRDGLQNEKTIIPTAVKIDFINRLSMTGLSTIETTSFVSPKWIPQLADADVVLPGITKQPGIRYPVLVPNIQGFERAISAGAKDIAVFAAATETFSEKNTHCSTAETLKHIEAILQLANKHDIAVRGYISCSLGCPYEGVVLPKTVATLAGQLFQMGCSEIALGDTLGIGTPHRAQALIHAVAEHVPIQQLAVHFHDTYGQALANIYACLEMGIAIVDSAITGLGGCPYAKGTSGNVATEDVVYLLDGMGIKTDVNFDVLIAVSQFVTTLTNQPPRSKVAQARLRV